VALAKAAISALAVSSLPRGRRRPQAKLPAQRSAFLCPRPLSTRRARSPGHPPSAAWLRDQVRRQIFKSCICRILSQTFCGCQFFRHISFLLQSLQQFFSKSRSSIEIKPPPRSQFPGGGDSRLLRRERIHDRQTSPSAVPGIHHDLFLPGLEPDALNLGFSHGNQLDGIPRRRTSRPPAGSSRCHRSGNHTGRP